MMRAKMNISSIVKHTTDADEVTQVDLTLNAVCSDETFGENGESENNSYSRWTPNASLTMSITNPDLFDKFEEGDEYYLDFTKAVKADSESSEDAEQENVG